MSFKEDLLGDLTFYRTRFMELPESLFLQLSSKYYTNLRGILLRYIKSHYSVVIHTSFDKYKVQIMTENCPDKQSEIAGLHMMYVKLENLNKDEVKKKDLERLYDVMITLLTENTKRT